MHLDGKLIAILGPNEAGKTSFLNAMTHLNDEKPFIVSDGLRELSRGENIQDDRVVIEALYLLDDDDDRKSVEEIEGTKDIKWLEISKFAGGYVRTEITPRPKRNLSRRRSVVESLQSVLKEIENIFVKEPEGETKELLREIINATDSLIEQLDAEQEDTLHDETIAEIKALAERYQDTVAEQTEASRDTERIKTLAERYQDTDLRPDKMSSVASNLLELAEAELYYRRTPHDLAAEILAPRRPRFLNFDRESRDLKPEYDLNEVGRNMPIAFKNLFDLAELSFEKLINATIYERNQGDKETLISKANQILKDKFKKVWSQSDVSVRLSVDGNTLYFLMDEKNRSFNSIAERSDGLRQYVALLLYLKAKETTQPPILLIDEAETHLHYDAQADLVQMLARQESVAKVIYTTHSVGCLPEDIGSGTRLISPKDANTSKIKNWFWETSQPGFSPILFGMGAATLAFFPFRYALITEGPTDMILLPTLLREATGRDFLGFQVTPGISVSDEEKLTVLESGSPRTLYLIDGDDGGSELQRRLQKAKIPKSHIFKLPSVKESKGLVLEDLIDDELYVEAINEELRRSHDDKYVFPLDKLPNFKRPKYLETYCKSKGVKPPSKRSVACRLLELKENRQLIKKKGIAKE